MFPKGAIYIYDPDEPCGALWDAIRTAEHAQELKQRETPNVSNVPIFSMA